MFQACRGKTEQNLVVSRFQVENEDSPSPVGDQVNNNSSSNAAAAAAAGKKRPLRTLVANDGDLFVMWATAEENVAYRHDEEGSYFIQAVCRVLQEVKTNKKNLCTCTEQNAQIVSYNLQNPCISVNALYQKVNRMMRKESRR